LPLPPLVSFHAEAQRTAEGERTAFVSEIVPLAEGSFSAHDLQIDGTADG